MTNLPPSVIALLENRILELRSDLRIRREHMKEKESAYNWCKNQYQDCQNKISDILITLGRDPGLPRENEPDVLF